MGKGKYKSKRTSAWLGFLESLLSLISLHRCLGSSFSFSLHLKQRHHYLLPSLREILQVTPRHLKHGCGWRPPRQRALRVSSFSPPSCWENDWSHGGKSNTPGKWSSHQQKANQNHVDKFPWGTAEGGPDDLGRSSDSQNG